MHSSIDLSETELKILNFLREIRVCKASDIAVKLGLPLSTVMAMVESLKVKGAVKTTKIEVKEYTLTEEGKEYSERGLPELRLYKLIIEEKRTISTRELIERGFSKKELSIALKWLREKKLTSISKEGIKAVKVETLERAFPEQTVLNKIKAKGAIRSTEISADEESVIHALKSRGLVKEKIVVDVIVEITPTGEKTLETAKPVISALTHDLIVSGAWRKYTLKPYNVSVKPPRVYPGKKHFYLEFIDYVKRILVAMGFEEAEGPYVDMEFWNFDILFQAQDHPAREIHDTFWIKKPKYGSLDENLDVVKRVKEVHESGWKYRWDINVARRFILRTQTTQVSARYLVTHREPPVKMFAIGKVFRPDQIDAKHLPEFYQFDGIVMDKGLTFKNLLGIVVEFFKQLGIEKVMFKPGYFPFTEPSVEGYIYHPRIGWVECFGAGMFRPEVLKALGVKYPVAAWGMGLDRIAMILLGVNDIRMLYSQDIDYLRNMSLR